MATKKELQELGQRLAADLTQDGGRSFKDHLSDLLDGLGLKSEAGNVRALNWAGGSLDDVAVNMTGSTLWNAEEVQNDVAEAVGEMTNEKDEEIEEIKTKRDKAETERDDAAKGHEADVAEAVAEAEKERDEERIEHEKDMAEAEKNILGLEGEIEDLKKVSTLPTGGISGLVSLAVNHEGEARREGYDDAVKFLQAFSNQPHLGIEYVCWVMNAAKVEAAELIDGLKADKVRLQTQVRVLDTAYENNSKYIKAMKATVAGTLQTLMSIIVPEPAPEAEAVALGGVKVGDSVTVSGCAQDSYNGTKTVERILENDHVFDLTPAPEVEPEIEIGKSSGLPFEAELPSESEPEIASERRTAEMRLCTQCKEFFGSVDSKPLKNRQGKVFCTAKCRRVWNKENK